MAAPPRAAAFDVIGTTFSLESVRTALTQAGFPNHVLETWFARTLRDGFALAATDTFAPFRVLFESNLEELARSHSVSIKSEQKEQILGQFGALSAHSDARHAFQTLNDAGIRVFALSNGALATSRKLLENARLDTFVERVISVEDIRVFKPRREIYLHAAQVAGIAPAEMMLIATHAWDVHGAKRAGLMAAFVARGQQFPGTMETPNVIGDTLLEVARAITA